MPREGDVIFFFKSNGWQKQFSKVFLFCYIHIAHINTWHRLTWYLIFIVKYRIDTGFELHKETFVLGYHYYCYHFRRLINIVMICEIYSEVVKKFLNNN